MYINIFNEFDPSQEQLEGNPRESTSMEPENSYQKLITKYTAPKARKRDI
jgi:hypothetical protein